MRATIAGRAMDGPHLSPAVALRFVVVLMARVILPVFDC